MPMGGKSIKNKEASRLDFKIEVQALISLHLPKDIIRRMLRNPMQVAEKEKKTQTQIRHI